MPIIDKLDNLSLLRKKIRSSARASFVMFTTSTSRLGCMPTSEKLKESYSASVTHLKNK